MKYLILTTAAICLLASTLPAKDVQYVGDVTVYEDEVITEDIIAYTGDITIKGKVTGSVIAYWGDITLESTAEVSGSVIAKRGEVFRHPSALVSGEVLENRVPEVNIGRQETVLATARWEDDEEDFRHHRWRNWSFNSETDLEVNYTKVDGFYLGLKFDHFPLGNYGMNFRSFGAGGYAFASQTWQGQIGFGMGLGKRNQIELSVDAYSRSHTEDAWYMSDKENSLAAFFLHEDFRDYYNREGYGVSLVFEPLEFLNLSVRYQAEQHTTLENDASWALFGGNKEFLPNMPVEEGMLREFVLSARLDSRDDVETPEVGWYLQGAIELTNPDFASDFDYRRMVVDARRYQPLTSFVNFDTRIRIGNSEGTLPVQKRFYLGGPSTLPGFGLKAFSGREFALLNAELRLHENGRGHGVFFNELGFFFFADVGMASDIPLNDLETEQWASDVGLGISADSGNIRLQVAKRTDTSEEPYVFMFRIQRPF